MMMCPETLIPPKREPSKAPRVAGTPLLLSRLESTVGVPYRKAQRPSPTPGAGSFATPARSRSLTYSSDSSIPTLGPGTGEAFGGRVGRKGKEGGWDSMILSRRGVAHTHGAPGTGAPSDASLPLEAYRSGPGRRLFVPCKSFRGSDAGALRPMRLPGKRSRPCAPGSRVNRARPRDDGAVREASTVGTSGWNSRSA